MELDGISLQPFTSVSMRVNKKCKSQEKSHLFDSN